MKRFFICALGASQPGTMGGNTKIAVEMARCLASECETHVFLPRYKLPTFTNNLPSDHRVILHALEDFPDNDKLHPVGTLRWYTPRVRALFKELKVGRDDIVFGCSDFHCDVLPIYPLQKEFGFRWIPSVFLFVPFVFENLRQGYRFPPLKYLVYWFYQRVLFFLMKRRATGFVVTNESDFRYFPKRFRPARRAGPTGSGVPSVGPARRAGRDGSGIPSVGPARRAGRDGRLFPYYGGVNIDQIPNRMADTSSDPGNPSTNRRIENTNNLSVIFCSRLHPQKGIDGFLDVWKIIHEQVPAARFTIIGNGAPDYEQYLRDKAARLGIADSIEWMGYVNNAAKYRLYARSRLLVHATVFDNNGMVAAEALCTGLPVVMYDLPALRHVYTTGCVKIPFGDKSAFAAEVVRLLTDAKHYARVAPTPEQIAALRAHWDWASRAREFKDWLASLEPNAGNNPSQSA